MYRLALPEPRRSGPMEFALPGQNVKQTSVAAGTNSMIVRIVLGCLLIPIAVYTGWKAFTGNIALNDISDQTLKWVTFSGNRTEWQRRLRLSYGATAIASAVGAVLLLATA